MDWCLYNRDLHHEGVKFISDRLYKNICAYFLSIGKISGLSRDFVCHVNTNYNKYRQEI